MKLLLLLMVKVMLGSSNLLTLVFGNSSTTYFKAVKKVVRHTIRTGKGKGDLAIDQKGQEAK